MRGSRKRKLGGSTERTRSTSGVRRLSGRGTIFGYIRQLCVSGIDSHLLAPLLLEAIGALMGADGADHGWENERGSIGHGYAGNREMHALVPAHLELFGGSDLERVAFGIDSETAVRAGLASRKPDRHGPGDRRALSQLSPLLARALRAPGRMPEPLVETRDSAFLLADARGHVVLTSETDLPLLLMLHDAAGEGTRADPCRLPAFLLPLVHSAARPSQALPHTPPVAKQTTRWGRFECRAYATRRPDGRSAGLVVVHVRRYEPLSLRVLRNGWRAGLSERQREVCLHLAAGLSHSAIAKAMRIQQSTVIDYVRKIYAKLDVANREALLQLLSK
ncbi:MAG TPA: helix-turn-helix transcriptional regulator [Gammaproteobacteria bacterium]|nr:helix-turn-helix transcriptional regulator [Gammaproteobacteria bacterium]